VTRCRVCRGGDVGDLLDCGPQPLSNRYLHRRDESEYRHPLVAGICRECGVVQLTEPPPAAELAPRFDWISYREPEDHLDSLVETMVAFAGLDGDAVVGGVSYKDDTTLRRFRERGFGRTWRIDTRRHLGLASERAEIETVQDRLDPARAAAAITGGLPRADILLARHILEHAQRTVEFQAALRALVAPGGLVAVEVPDAGRSLDHRDYTTLWEEHVLYCTEATLPSVMRAGGFVTETLIRFPYASEDSLVLLARRVEEPAEDSPSDALEGELDRWQGFAGGFGDTRRRSLAALSAETGGIALLGAGHLAATWINLMGAAPLISFVADDDPNKQGLLMPGSRLPIRPSAALYGGEVGLCLMAVSSGLEARVLERHAPFAARGGRFASIFPQSPRSLLSMEVR
jgi:hypothetical protein